MKRGWLGLVVVSSVALASCTSSRTFVLQPVQGGELKGHIALSRLESTQMVDPRANEEFEATLTDHLKGDLGASIGTPPDLVLQYRFVLFDTGSTGARVGSGLASLAGSPLYGIGDGSVGVEVVYQRPDGTMVGHIVTDGPISGAFGSTSGALDSAAAAVARYTKANFTCKDCGHLGPANPSPEPVQGLRQASAGR